MMTHQQILDEAIQKAIDGGWKQFDEYEGWQLRVFGKLKWTPQTLFAFYREIMEGDEVKQWEYSPQFSVSDLILDHSFAKALWGTKEVHHYDLVDLDDGGKTTVVTKPIWHYHLQRMVVAHDPIQYLGEHLHV